MTTPDSDGQNGERIALALSGGGSRAIAFHLGCLRALHELAERTEEQLFLKGQALCIQGESGDDVYLIIEGSTEAIQVRGGRQHLLGINHQGECVGEMAILDPGPRVATVRAVENRVRTLTVHGDIFRSLLNRDTATSMSVIRLLIHRQRQAAQSTS